MSPSRSCAANHWNHLRILLGCGVVGPIFVFIFRYDWIKVATPVSDADKALVTEMWCSETTVEGKPVLDGKVFK